MTSPPGITAHLIKACGDAILPPLHYLFNLSISSLTFPDQWKSAIVTPLFKSGSTSDPNNYRPISVLPVISKLLEPLIHNQMTDHLTASNPLSSNQYGFRKGYSTGTCLVDFLDVVYDNIENARPTGVLFLDLKKVFDTVDHEILLERLNNFGFNKSVQDWMLSYLCDCTQVTKVSNSISEPSPVRCGVPQGSIIGPLMFTLYIDSLPKALTNVDTFLYVDDTAIVASDKDPSVITDKLNTALSQATSGFKIISCH